MTRNKGTFTFWPFALEIHKLDWKQGIRLNNRVCIFTRMDHGRVGRRKTGRKLQWNTGKLDTLYFRIINIKDTDHQVMQLKDEKAWEKERLKTKEKLKEKFKEIQNCIHLHSQNFASKMLITNRQPARSAPDPGPLPGNIITSWQKNSEVIHYQILKYVLQFDNIQRYINLLQSQLEGISSGWSNTSRELMDSVLGMRRDLFSQTIISIILWSLERSQEGWAYRKKMKNTENIAFPSRFEEPDDFVKWSDREAPERHAAWRLPMLREKNTKNIAGTFCDLQVTGGPESPLPRTPPQWDAPFPKIHARLVSFTQFCHLL